MDYNFFNLNIGTDRDVNHVIQHPKEARLALEYLTYMQKQEPSMKMIVTTDQADDESKKIKDAFWTSLGKIYKIFK